MALFKKTLYKPITLKNKEDLKILLKNKNIEFVDAFSHQMKELFYIKNKSFVGIPKKDAYKTKEFKGFCIKNENNFIHVYYPWNNSLVKTFPKKEYLELKTNRNQDLITQEEQDILRNIRVGVFGMSVGSNIAFVLTQAGISNDITIADFDTLDTTNLNRILAGLHQVGLPKVVVASRRIYEDNPFAKVNLMPKGVSVKDLEKVLKAKKLDILIDEIDDIKMKIDLRLLALKYKLPVLMLTDNGDGVVLHIERYDLGYNKIFEKDITYWKNVLNQNFTKEIAGKIIMEDILGGIHNIDPKMLRSVERVLKKELISWSQLGSAAILGGVVVTIFIKRILIDKDDRPYVLEYVNI